MRHELWAEIATAYAGGRAHRRLSPRIEANLHLTRVIRRVHGAQGMQTLAAEQLGDRRC